MSDDRTCFLKNGACSRMASRIKSTGFMLYTFFVRLIIIYAFGASSYLFTRLIGPSLTGFFCDDNSIKFPYHDSTVQIEVLLTICYLLLFISILTIEPVCHNIYYSKISKEPSKKIGNVFIHSVVPRSLEIFVISQLGFMITIFLFNLTKAAAGRLRPNFVASCQPNITWNECNPGTFVQNYECLSKNVHRARESRLSFYSGHTAESFYYVVFLILYIHAKLGRKFRSSVIFPLVYVCLISGAIFVGCSRIWDYKHHPSDVIFGGIMGTFTAILLVYNYRHVIFDINYDIFPAKSADANLVKVPISIDDMDPPVVVTGSDELLQVTRRNLSSINEEPQPETNI